MSKEIGSQREIYEGSVRDRLESLFLASGGKVSKAVAHRQAIEHILSTGSTADLQEYFLGDAFESDRHVRDHEMRYAAMTAVVGLLFTDTHRKEALLSALRAHAPLIGMTRAFVSQNKYLSDNHDLLNEIVSASGVAAGKIEVFMQVLEHTSDASIDNRGKNKDVTRALEHILHAGLMTLDAILSHMHACVLLSISDMEPSYRAMSDSEKQDIIKKIMTVSLHRGQAVAGMPHNLSTKLFNTDTTGDTQWEMLRRNDGQLVVTTGVLERYLHDGGALLSRLQTRHREGDSRLRHAQGCPVMILPLFLHAGRAMIERYSKIVS